MVNHGTTHPLTTIGNSMRKEVTDFKYLASLVKGHAKKGTKTKKAHVSIEGP